MLNFCCATLPTLRLLLWLPEASLLAFETFGFLLSIWELPGRILAKKYRQAFNSSKSDDLGLDTEGCL